MKTSWLEEHKTYVCYEHMCNFTLHQNYIVDFKHAQFNALLLMPWNTVQIYSCFF